MPCFFASSCSSQRSSVESYHITRKRTPPRLWSQTGPLQFTESWSLASPQATTSEREPVTFWSGTRQACLRCRPANISVRIDHHQRWLVAYRHHDCAHNIVGSRVRGDVERTAHGIQCHRTRAVLPQVMGALAPNVSHGEDSTGEGQQTLNRRRARGADSGRPDEVATHLPVSLPGDAPA